ncbi:MAG: hypothetical protein M3419_04970 [Actinomycetota bacterium]|nr:hypothetical protein [Actinomycetota bacterium]
MTNAPYAAKIDTTDLPCPDWCTLPTGHGFCSVGEHDTFLRYHECTFVAEYWTSDQQDRNVVLHVSIDMADSENAATEAGPIIETTAPLVYVEVGSGMTGPQTRELAAKLLEAAELWDRVTS